MKKEEIQELALNVRFEVNEEETKDIEKDFVTLEKMLEFFDSINTDGVEEMVYPFEDATDYFREDEVSNVISQTDALSNVAKTRQGHIVVPKVVK